MRNPSTARRASRWYWLAPVAAIVLTVVLAVYRLPWIPAVVLASGALARWQWHQGWESGYRARSDADTGRCGELCPLPVTGMTLVCELLAGHSGMHRDGPTHFSVLTQAPNAEST